jgi:hypothetical protein
MSQEVKKYLLCFSEFKSVPNIPASTYMRCTALKPMCLGLEWTKVQLDTCAVAPAQPVRCARHLLMVVGHTQPRPHTLQIHQL